MADVQINDLLADPTPLLTDELETQKTGGGASFKLTLQQIGQTINAAFNVRDYGATGDGVTDDSAAINAAADAANAAGGGVVFFPKGTYVAELIEVYNTVYFQGEGIDVSIIQLKGGQAATNHLFFRTSTALLEFGGIIACSLLGGPDRDNLPDYNGVHLRNSIGLKSQQENLGRWEIRDCLIRGFKVGVHGTEDDRHLSMNNNWFRDNYVCLFTTHHTEFKGKNDFRRSQYGIGHGSIISGGTTGMFDQSLSNLKINCFYGIWPLTIDDSNVVHATDHYIPGETLEPMRACDLSASLFSCDIAAVCIGTETSVRGCQFVVSGIWVEALIVVGGPDSTNAHKNWSIIDNKFRTIEPNSINATERAETDIFGNPIATGGAIEGITLAGTNPVQITTTGHTLQTGDEVRFQDVGGTIELNGNWYTITRLDADNYTLDGTDSTNFSPWTSGGVILRGRTLNGAAIVVDSGNAEVFQGTIAYNAFDCDTATAKCDFIRLQDGQSVAIGTSARAMWNINVTNNLWRHRPDTNGAYNSQFLVADGPRQAINLSLIAENHIWIHGDESGTEPIIKILDTSNTFSIDYVSNVFRITPSRYAIEADLEDGTVANNRVFQGLGSNFTNIRAQSNISANFVSGVRDSGGNIYNA